MLAAYVGLGLVVGFVAGLLGVGGGLIIVPVLIFMLHAQGLAAGMEPQLALGTSLAAILFTSLSSVRAHHRHGAVEWPLVRRIAPGIVLGTLAGALLAAQMSALLLKGVFVVFLFYAAIQMWLDFKPAPHRGLPGRAGHHAGGQPHRRGVELGRHRRRHLVGAVHAVAQRARCIGPSPPRRRSASR